MAYADEARLYLLFGQANIRKWADADNAEEETDIDARIEWALDWATDYINAKLTGRKYVIPFDPVPNTIADICAQLAGVKLYQLPRGTVDGDTSLEAVTAAKEDADLQLDWLNSGELRLDSTSIQNAPEVVNFI